jgi:hypothetical protein
MKNDTENKKKVILQRMSIIFNEWANRYADNPDEFGEILDENGRPFEDYGDGCAAYFDQIGTELDNKGVLPKI